MNGDHGPGVRIPPPVMVGATLLAAWVIGRVAPMPVLPPLPLPGLAGMALGLGLIGWAVLCQLRAGTDPRPDRPDAVLVETGPFRWSRNPIYLGFLLSAAGLALSSGQLWFWLAVAISAALLQRVVVAREEAYLDRRFGTAYAAYRGRVRRWL